MAVFYRKYRPQKLADLIGQDNVRDTLLGQLESGKIGHGYLFSGPRGSGKTSTARILAKAVNCEVYANKKKDAELKFGEPCNRCNACRGITDGSYLDLIEIDAASNRGIDEIRDLRDKIKLSPVSGKFKVYIIDEVHMLTPEAFNALLKTLEEPPAHAIFILCTTNPGKLPATIISRLSRFNFKKATVDDLSRVILKVAKLENVKIEKEAVSAIAKAADGAYRDALSILDQLASAKKTITEKDVKAAYKLTSAKVLDEFLEAVFVHDLRASVLLVSEIGVTHDIQIFILDAIILLKKLLFIKIGAGVQTDEDGRGELAGLAQKATYPEIQNLMKLLLVAEAETHLYPLPEIALTLAVCKFLPEAEREMSSVAGKSAGPVSSFLPVSARPGRSPDRVDRDQSELRAVGNPSIAATGKEANAKVSKKDAKSMADLEAKWGEFLAKVRPHNAHVVALLKSTRPSTFDGANLVLEVFFKFHKEKLEEPKIMNLLCEVLEEVLGRPVSLKFVLANRESRPTKTVTVSDVAEIGDDELSKMAAEIFSK